jgi:hypothetical protein
VVHLSWSTEQLLAATVTPLWRRKLSDLPPCSWGFNNTTFYIFCLLSCSRVMCHSLLPEH